MPQITPQEQRFADHLLAEVRRIVHEELTPPAPIAETPIATAAAVPAVSEMAAPVAAEPAVSETPEIVPPEPAPAAPVAAPIPAKPKAKAWTFASKKVAPKP